MSAAEFSPFDLLPDEIVIKIILEAVNPISWSYSESMDYRNIIHHQIEKCDFLRIAMVSTRFKRLTEDKCFDDIIIKIIREAVKSSFSIYIISGDRLSVLPSVKTDISSLMGYLKVRV